MKKEDINQHCLMNPLLHSSQLYGILDTGYVTPENMTRMTQQLLQGGIRILQLRAKKSSPQEIITIARQILPYIRAQEGMLFLNDHPDLVPKVDADGVHIGQEDLTHLFHNSLEEVKRLAGKKALVGLSTHSLQQVQESLEQHPDYIGFGPLFATPTKPDYPAIGLTDLIKAQEMAPFPIFCIGGITLETAPQAINAGAKRIVVVSDLLKAAEPAAKARQLLALLPPLSSLEDGSR